MAILTVAFFAPLLKPPTFPRLSRINCSRLFIRPFFQRPRIGYSAGRARFRGNGRQLRSERGWFGWGRDRIYNARGSRRNEAPPVEQATSNAIGRIDGHAHIGDRMYFGREPEIDREVTLIVQFTPGLRIDRFMPLPCPLVDLHNRGDTLAHVELRVVFTDQDHAEVLAAVQPQRRKDEREVIAVSLRARRPRLTFIKRGV